MKFKSNETRKLAINAIINKNLTIIEAAKVFDVSTRTIYKWVADYKKTGSYERRLPSGRPFKLTEEREVQLLKFVEEKPDRTLNELAELLGDVKKSCINVHLIRLKQTYKKNSKSL